MYMQPPEEGHEDNKRQHLKAPDLCKSQDMFYIDTGTIVHNKTQEKWDENFRERSKWEQDMLYVDLPGEHFTG